MTLEIDLAPEEEAKLRDRASTLGLDLPAFFREAALEKADRPSLAEILAPIHEDTRRRGITIEQIDDAIDRARRAHHADQSGR